MKFFNINVETPKGDWELLEKVMEGANKPEDPSDEERRGGADDVGKLFLSAGESAEFDRLICMVHVPKALADEKGLSAKVAERQWHPRSYNPRVLPAISF